MSLRDQTTPAPTSKEPAMSTRHVTLCVTHPGGAGHLTLDHHVPVAVAVELKSRMEAAWTLGGGRYVTLLSSPNAASPRIAVEVDVQVDDATAAALVAWLLPHMPPHVQDALR